MAHTPKTTVAVWPWPVSRLARGRILAFCGVFLLTVLVLCSVSLTVNTALLLEKRDPFKALFQPGDMVPIRLDEIHRVPRAGDSLRGHFEFTIIPLSQPNTLVSYGSGPRLAKRSGQPDLGAEIFPILSPVSGVVAHFAVVDVNATAKLVSSVLSALSIDTSTVDKVLLEVASQTSTKLEQVLPLVIPAVSSLLDQHIDDSPLRDDINATAVCQDVVQNGIAIINQIARTTTYPMDARLQAVTDSIDVIVRRGRRRHGGVGCALRGYFSWSSPGNVVTLNAMSIAPGAATSDPLSWIALAVGSPLVDYSISIPLPTESTALPTSSLPPYGPGQPQTTAAQDTASCEESTILAGTASSAGAVTTPSSLLTPASDTAPPASNSLQSWQYVGCFHDAINRTLAGSKPLDYLRGDMSNSTCIDHCKSRGYTFAGTECGKECWCGSSIRDDAVRLPDSSCGSPCQGAGGQFCGGDWAISVFTCSDASGPASGNTPAEKSCSTPPATSEPAPSTSESTPAAYEPPETLITQNSAETSAETYRPLL
ncbi:hypothetical protein ACCO45_006648 [Purpureocillium lilacinum]|uniref:Uncharacterized protein n=1 Tax=Purpureocillium lilacinum TaxID=33203 RepID=A0ACC4DQ28_PURLI